MPRDNSHYGPGYQAARVKAFRRTGGMCAFCGHHRATDAHHWAPRGKYPDDWHVRARDLTPLCRGCHIDATLKRAHGAGGKTSIVAMLRTLQSMSPPKDGSHSEIGLLFGVVQESGDHLLAAERDRDEWKKVAESRKGPVE